MTVFRLHPHQYLNCSACASDERRKGHWHHCRHTLHRLKVGIFVNAVNAQCNNAVECPHGFVSLLVSDDFQGRQKTWHLVLKMVVSCPSHATPIMSLRHYNEITECPDRVLAVISCHS